MIKRKRRSSPWDFFSYEPKIESLVTDKNETHEFKAHSKSFKPEGVDQDKLNESKGSNKQRRRNLRIHNYVEEDKEQIESSKNQDLHEEEVRK